MIEYDRPHTPEPSLIGCDSGKENTGCEMVDSKSCLLDLTKEPPNDEYVII